MSVLAGDYLSLSLWGVVKAPEAEPSIPAEPTLSVANDGDGDAVTATVAGTEGITYRLLYRRVGAAGWTEGNTRTGSGTIAQAGLDAEAWYEFQAVGSDGDYRGYGSAVAALFVTASSPLTPTGVLALAMDNLRSLLAESATFQDWIGAAGTSAQRIAAAKLKLFIEGIDEVPGEAYDTTVAGVRPYGVIMEHRRLRGEKRAETAYVEEGTISAMFEALVPPTYAASHRNVSLWFQGKLGAILSEALELSGDNGRFVITGYELREIHRAAKKVRTAQGDFAIALFDVSWR